jgi:hypothetical protein
VGRKSAFREIQIIGLGVQITLGLQTLTSIATEFTLTLYGRRSRMERVGIATAVIIEVSKDIPLAQKKTRYVAALTQYAWGNMDHQPKVGNGVTIRVLVVPMLVII